MIRVTIEIVPGGIGKPQTYHVIEIWNDLKATLQNPRRGNYRYRISRKISEKQIVKHPSWHKEGDVENFPRAAKNVVHLLGAVLKDAGYTP